MQETTNTPEIDAVALRLVWLPVNQAFAFTYGRAGREQLLRMGDAPMFHETKASAYRAAEDCGLAVDANGFVTTGAQAA